MLDTCLVHGEHIRISFDQETLTCLSYSTLCPIEPIELTTLRVDQALGRIDILSYLISLGENTSTKGNIAPTQVTYREDHSSSESIYTDTWTILIDGGETYCRETIQGIARSYSLLRKSRLAIQGIA